MASKTGALLTLLGISIGEEMTAEKINEVFKNFKEVKKTLNEYEKKTLKPFLFESAEKLGTLTESGGNKVLLEDGTGWEKQARVSVSVDEEKAVELLDSKNLFEYIDYTESISEENLESVIKLLKASNREDLITTTTSVTNSSLEQAYLKGDITDDELGSLVQRKVTYALVEVNPKEKKK